MFWKLTLYVKLNTVQPLSLTDCSEGSHEEAKFLFLFLFAISLSPNSYSFSISSCHLLSTPSLCACDKMQHNMR